MEYPEQQRIDECWDRLISDVYIPSLLPLLFRHGVFHHYNCNLNYWMNDLYSEKTAQEVFSTIKKCGPHAFAGLVLCLAHLGHYDIIHSMEHGSLPSTTEQKRGFWKKIAGALRNSLRKRDGFEAVPNEIN
ncbi:uncharacterized protein [Fopius arisanus]|uniref:Uncharacterized protein n=1 Tax=Fopius arisanus TaxID=64838 RepID=A0A9R1TNF9_9HYME|nr:PREDICTED: uncharacterized protein LOC105272164 [Fopius arisanus]